MMTKTNIARWGNSLALRLPKDLADRMGLIEGSVVSLEADQRRLTVELEPRVPTLDELLDGVKPDAAGGEIDWGDPVGKEAW